MMKIPIILTAILFVSATTTFAQQATFEDFRRYGDAIEGRWIGAATWGVDIPHATKPSSNFAKTGDKVIAFIEADYIEDGHAMRVRFFGGEISVTGMYCYDSATKAIRIFWVNSEGMLSDEYVVPDGKAWKSTGKRMSKDGTTLQVNVSIEFAQDGQSWTVKGNEDLGVSSTWQRVSQAKDSPEGFKLFQEFGQACVGRWVDDVTYIEDWPDPKANKGGKAVSYEEFRWVLDGYGIEQVSFDNNSTGRLVFVWNSVSKQIIAIANNSGSGAAFATVKRRDDGVWVFNLTGGGMANGESMTGTVTWTITPDGKRIQTGGLLSLDGKLLDPMQDVMHRVNPPVAK